MTEGWPPKKETGKQTDLYIVYHNDDAFRIKKTILPFLDAANITYVLLHENEWYSGDYFTLIRTQINKCKKTMLVLAKETFKKLNISLEVILALEKSVKQNKMSLILLLLDELRKEDVSKISLLEHASYFSLNNNIHEVHMRAFARRIKEERDINVLLPAGNFATGMAWSHFLGYLRHILPELAAHVRKSKWFNENVGHMPVCFFMLLPTSATGPRKISDVDPNVEYVGSMTIEAAKRQFTPAVYKITDPDTKTAYYCCAEYPSALCALGIMSKQRLCEFNARERTLEVERFHHKLDEIIGHDKNRMCNGLAKCLMYNDEGNDEKALPSYHLLRAIKEEVTERLLHPKEYYYNAVEEFYKSVGQTFEFDVCILHENSDQRRALTILTFLQEKRIRVAVARPGPSEPIHKIAQKIANSRWTILLISKQAMRGWDWVTTFLAETLSLSFENQFLRVLPVLLDALPSDIPDFIRWVTYIDSKETNYLERILEAVEALGMTPNYRVPGWTRYYEATVAEAVKGRCISMQSQIPVGDVAFGLAWAFHVNYLRHVLPDLPRRVDEAMKTNAVQASKTSKKTYVSKILYEIIPKSCTCPFLLTDKDREMARSEKVMKGPWPVEPIKKDIAGTVGRVYPCKMYKIEDSDADYYFCGEFLSPIRTLKDMNQSMIAGLDYHEMSTQSSEMQRQLEAILESKATPLEFKDKCTFVEYDDSIEELVDVLVKRLKGDYIGGGLAEFYCNFVVKDQKLV